MAGEWPALLLEDCMEAVIDYRGKTPEKTASGIPLITAKVVKRGRIETPDEFIAVEDYEAWMRRGTPKAGDVVVTTEAPLGEVAQLGTERVALAQRLIALRGKTGLLDNRFLKFLMQSEDVQEQLRARASGTTVLGIKQSELRRILLTLPPFAEQRAIAHILATLDDKIELNRRMNETLEAMARALFKSWFVDFDPVRAKANLPSPSGRGVGGEGRAGGEGHHRPSHAYPPTELRDFARALRDNQTDAEHLMWLMLRDRRIAGAKFRRQHPVPPYVLDFYCHELKLAIELDGGQHGEPTGRERDQQRDAALSERGITVLRFWNNEVLNETEAVLEQIYQTVTERALPSPQTPLPEGEGLYGLPKEVADLFPDSFEESELGEIPKGWEVRSLDEIARFLNGLALQKYPPEDGRFLPVIKIAQLRAGNTNEADRASADLEADYIVQDGDILFSWSGSLECVLWAGGPGALNQHLFKVTSDKYPRWLCYLGIHQYLADFRHIAAGKATTMGHIQRRHLSDAKLPVPSRALLHAMDHVIGPIIESMWRRAVQSRALAAMRDALLPKLISGELRVGTTGKLVEVTL